MSEAQMEPEAPETTSAEEKFFGVRTQIGKSRDEVSPDSDIELEIVDDRSAEDRRPPKSEALSDNEDDDELEGYSEKVQKRINKLRYEQHEERRQREAAEKMREEAVRVAQQLASKNKEMESLINRGEGALVAQIKQRAELSLQHHFAAKVKNSSSTTPTRKISSLLAHQGSIGETPANFVFSRPMKNCLKWSPKGSGGFFSY